MEAGQGMRILVLFFLAVNLSAPAIAKPGKFGLGVVIVNPTGFSVNYKLKRSKSIDAALSFDLDGDDFHFHSTYLWHKYRAFSDDKYRFGWYAGIGVRVLSKKPKFSDKKFWLGPRGSLGLNFPFMKRRFDAFVEGALIMNVIEETDLDADFALGARYYF